MYEQSELATSDVLGLVGQTLPEVLADLVFDKVLGNVPVVGVYFSAICAKALTWRLGTLFTMLSSRGAEVRDADAREDMGLIRWMFPREDMFRFTTPDKSAFLDLANSVEGSPFDDFNSKVARALDILRE